MDKTILREKYLRLRKQIDNKEEKSRIIKDRLIKLDEYLNSKKVGIYYSMDQEVDTKPIIEDLLDRKKEVYLPKVVGENMIFIKIDSLDFEKEKSSFGVTEPILNEKSILEDDLDLLIIPGICFDLSKNRVGYGKGFYDRYIGEKNIIKISLCFDKQVLINDTIQINTNDKKMDIVVTEERFF